MSETSMLAKIVEENPKIAAGAIVGTFGFVAKYLIFDPYRSCTMFLSIASAVFSLCLCVVLPIWIMEIDLTGLVDWGIATLSKLVALSGSAVGVYSMWKKATRVARKKRITKARK